MTTFENIYQRAIERKGGLETLNQLLPQQPDKADIIVMPESRFLAEMTRCIFQAGFVWKVINQKWDGFEDVFYGFEPNTILGLLPDDWEAITKDARIVRNAQKIYTVRANAQLIEDIAIAFGSFGQWIANWPETELIDLFAVLKKRGARLGGNTGQRFLRNIGKDTFLLSKDVILCLKGSGLGIKDNPTSKRELSAIQERFNQWHEETKLPYTHLSKIAAYSIG